MYRFRAFVPQEWTSFVTGFTVKWRPKFDIETEDFNIVEMMEEFQAAEDIEVRIKLGEEVIFTCYSKTDVSSSSEPKVWTRITGSFGF